MSTDNFKSEKPSLKVEKPNLDAGKQQQQEVADQANASAESKPKEIGGPKGPEPTRYGDWEKNGRCYDF